MRGHKVSFRIALVSNNNTGIAQQTNIFINVVEGTLIFPFLIKIMQECSPCIFITLHWESRSILLSKKNSKHKKHIYI